MMALRSIPTLLLFAVVTSVAVPRASAAPMPLAGELPLTDADLLTLRTRLDFDELFDTLDFLGSLRVFEDDASTPQHPTFYLAPVFTADTHHDVIGGRQIACRRIR